MAGSGARGQVLFIIVLMPVLIMAMCLAATYVYQEELRGGRLVRDADRSQELLRLQIEEATASLHAVIDGLEEGTALTAALADGDARKLEHIASPTFSHLRDQHGISHLYFYRTDRTLLVRLDGNGKSGQVVDRMNLFESAETNGSSDGIDLNAFGVVTLRVTVGWRDEGGKLIGFVELGRDVAPMIDQIHRVMGLDILLLVKKDMLDRDRWEEGNRESGGQGSWDELANYVSVARTVPTIPTPVGLMLEDGQPDKNGGTNIVGVGKRSLALSVRPLIDLEDKEIGDVVLLRDVSEASRSMARTLIWLLVVSVAAIALSFWRVRWLLREEPMG